MVKRLPVTWETWVQFLGREDPLEKEMATYSSTLACSCPWVAKSWTRLSDFTSLGLLEVNTRLCNKV